MIDDNLIKLNPYLARAKTLIEYFFIIGYKEQSIQENFPYFQENEKNLEMSIISTIGTDSKIENLDFDDIIKRIYPNKPNIVRITKEDLKPKKTSIVFFSFINFNDNIKNVKKIFYSCYALRFYERFIDFNSREEYYIPKAFIILSQYPYFSTFHKICKNIYRSNIEAKEKNYKNKDKLKSEYYTIDNIPLEIFIHCLVNYIPSPLKKNIILNIFANEGKIQIPRLSGYPYIDFDLYKVINTTSINELIKIYILMLLEIPLLIFSLNLEKLNIFLYSLYILNYPLTDSHYFLHLKTISKNKMKNLITLFGVNEDLDENFDPSSFKGVSCLFDDKNIKIINIDYKTNESEEIRKLINYIDNIINNSKKAKQSSLNNIISSFKKQYENIRIIYNKKVKNFSDSLFSINENISYVNNKIQEAFYDLIISILNILYRDYKIGISCSSVVNIKDKKINFTEEENIFLKYFRVSDKYSNHFDNFIQGFNSPDEFKIPFLFCNDFVHLRKYDLKNEIPLKFSYFKIIDSFYSSENEYVDISFNNLYKDFKENKNIFINIKNTKKHQLFYLEKDIINIFLFKKKNKKNLFNSLREREKFDCTIESKDKTLIAKMIHNNFSSIFTPIYFIRASSVYIFSMCFTIFSFESSLFFLAVMLENTYKMNYFVRYYIGIVLESINKYYLENKKICQFPQLNLKNTTNYCDVIKAFLNDNYILPNEEIFLLLKKFLYNDKKINEENNINQKDSNTNHFVFEYGKIENYVNVIKYDIVEREENSLFFKFKGKRIEHKLLTSNSIFSEIYSLYNKYFTKDNCNIEYFPINQIIEIIVNLIYYLLLPNCNEKGLALYLFKTIIILNKLEEDLNSYKKKQKFEKNLENKDIEGYDDNNFDLKNKNNDFNNISNRTTRNYSEAYSIYN